MKNNQNTKKNKHDPLAGTYHSTIEPGRMEQIKVGSYSVKGVPPVFDIESEPTAEGGKDVVCKPIELVDFSSMTYELVYSCQNFSDGRVRVSFKWRGGQVPEHPRLKI